MPHSKTSASLNRILSNLSDDDFDALASKLERFEFPLGHLFAVPDELVEHVFFLESGMASVVVQSPEGQQTEAGVIGREGFAVPSAVMGSDRSPHKVQAQIPGFANSIRRSDLIAAVDRSPVLRDRLLRFAHVMAVQSAFTLLSNAVHQVDERLARWLLMCHDRCDSDDIPLTHDFMSLMLAVRRPSVTNALHILEGNGFLRSTTGYVEILDRPALEDFAGDAYGKPEAEYVRVLGPFR